MSDLASSAQGGHVRNLRTATGAVFSSRSEMEMAVSWLLSSGIYILDKNDPNYGAVYSHYGSTRAAHEFVYAEATGYVISLLKFLHARSPHPAFVEHARASGDWLLRWAERNDGVVAMGLKEGKEIREAYTFDNGVCCKGLLDLYELTADDRYLRCAEKIATWIVNEALNHDGSVKPVFDIAAGRFVQDTRIWYKVSGSFQAKIAMPLLQLSALNKNGRLHEAAMGICDWAIRQQRPDGSFPANEMGKTTYVHFHWYTVEALLYAHACQTMQQHLNAAKRAVNWALTVQGPDGTLPRWCGGLVRERASDVQAQSIRAFSLMNMLERRPELEQASRRASRFLLEAQATDRDRRLAGGFFEGTARKYRYFVGATRNMPSWATMFAIHALHLMGEVSSRDFFCESRFLF